MPDLETHLEGQTGEFRDFFWHRLRWRAVRGYVPSDSSCRLLDVGAGNGFLGDFLAADRPLAEYHFDEPIESLRDRLVDRYGADREVRSGGDRHGFQVVTLLDVIEHIGDAPGFLRELLDSVDRGTLFVVTVPALRALWSSWDVALGHHLRYDRKAMRALLSGLPVEVVEVSYLFPEMVVPGLWRAWRSRRSGSQGSGAEFPRIPRWLNESLYGLGKPLVDWRRRMPVGSSVIAAFRRL